MILRHLDERLMRHFAKYKEVMVLLGARQTGKTTILKRLFPSACYLLVDNEPVRKILETYDIKTYQTLFPADCDILVIDELHLVDNPGRVAKIIYDQKPNIKLVITGSSSFHLKNKTTESLAGRKIDYQLFPLTFSEYLYQQQIESSLNFQILENVLCGGGDADKLLPFDLQAILGNVLIYGLYPGMIAHPHDQQYLLNLVDSLIFKDLIDLQLIENRKLALQLLKVLAHQIGNLINYAELSRKLEADARTIKRYIEIFEQNFILYRLYPYSKNPRLEINKSPKIYFYDNGIRNALINNFNVLLDRNDVGALFENFIICELLKANSYQQTGQIMHFWRDNNGAEVDLVLNRGNELIGVEIKYGQGKISQAFRNKYPEATALTVNRFNFY